MLATIPEPLVQTLDKLVERHEQIMAQLSHAATASDPRQLAALSRELSELTPAVSAFEEYRAAVNDYQTAKSLSEDQDPAIRQLAEQEIIQILETARRCAEKISAIFAAKEETKSCRAFLEIRAGTGGAEATLFAGDLLRMYQRYLELQEWPCELISCSRHELGGWREAILHISSSESYPKLRYESGIHRVQRIPETESQGRIHTSACTVVVLPEHPLEDTIRLERSDLRIDTYRASGAGGQHVNKTASAVRITHLPSGISVECQQDRSQLRNRQSAMSLLVSRLEERRIGELQQQTADTRRKMVGTGDRSEKIRTYNFPQNRITDHRINLTLYNLTAIMEGKLDPLLDKLAAGMETEAALN